MKYWKGKKGTNKESQFGTQNDDGFVPDTIEITQNEYNTMILSLPPIVSPLTLLQMDIETMDFMSLSEAKTKIKTILERLRKGEK